MGRAAARGLRFAGRRRRLFLQHTYLTIVAKTLAARVLDLPVDDADDVLSGQALRDSGIHGAVESDFFDWVLLEPEGRDLVLRLARQVARFRLRDVEADVLKALYESLIDPAQRRDLGEYYTPDWLAAKLVAATLTEPLTAVALDPACGSGTFLFHALRRLLAAAREAGWSDARTVRESALRVRGLDVHPVAVIIARVTWLLALGDAIRERDSDLHVPVYLGDAMQWSLSQIGGLREIMLPVPGEGPLHVPAGIAENQSLFEPALRELSQGLEDDADPERVEQALGRIAGVLPADAVVLARTFARIQSLKRAGRNGIWPFILRNLIRPVWLSRPDQRADLLIGNPPWVAYRHLSPEMKVRMRDACQAMNLWVGGVLATQQDLAALFWARGAERYVKRGGTIAFVLPYAALNRPAFDGLRRGVYGSAEVRITAAWNLSLLREIFPTSSCVLIGTRATAGALPIEVTQFSGVVRRDASEAEADNSLSLMTVTWPAITTLAGASVYRSRFTNGATIYPRRFFIVQREKSGRLGASQANPRMRGRQGPLDRAPWLSVPPPVGPVELRFLRRLLLGENILPFRMTEVALAVLPIDGTSVINSDIARAAGYRYLTTWLQYIEIKWAEHASKRPDGALRMSIQERIDHMRGITLQISTPYPKIVYTKAGTRLSAALVEDASVIVENSAYWAPIGSLHEAHYLCAIINSDTVLQRVIPMQPRGWRDPRHFDNLVWELPIPEYDGGLDLHRRLAAAGAEAERIAATVALPEGDFRRKRRAIRDALVASGHAAHMEGLVAALLAG